MALLTSSDFIGYNDSYAVPAGGSGVIFNGSVDIIYLLVLPGKCLIL